LPDPDGSESSQKGVSTQLRDANGPTPDLGKQHVDSTPARVGRARASLVNRLPTALIGVVVVGLLWHSNVDSGRTPAPVRLARGDGDPQAQTTAFALSPDGTTIATIHQDGRVVLRSATEGESVRRVLGYGGNARAVAFSPDGRVLAIGGMQPGITLCDVGSTAAECILQIRIRETSAVASRRIPLSWISRRSRTWTTSTLRWFARN
jgi:WD40 repeat protein